MSIAHIIYLFGAFTLVAIALHVLNSSSLKRMVRLLGPKPYLYVFGWIGVPIHELGHMTFCLIFGHRIVKIKLLDSTATEGTWGYVSHTWNKRNVYHMLGNLFIGIGPIITGSIIIWMLASLIMETSLHSTREVILNHDTVGYFEGMERTISASFHIATASIWKSFNFLSAKTWLFVYLSSSISSCMHLSSDDLKHIPGASALLFFLIFCFNLLTSWQQAIAYTLLDSIVRVFSPLFSIMVFCIFLCSGLWVAMVILEFVFGRRR